MATILAADVISRASLILVDTTKVRWSEEELANWLSDGQRAAAVINPSVGATNAAVALSAGTTRQTLPANGVMLFSVVRNMGANGATPGSAVRVASREAMDAYSADWHSEANAAGRIQHFLYDPRDPKTYYVYPKAPATPWHVELSYSAVPAAIPLVGTSPNKTLVAPNATTISIGDEYASALVDYLLYRAYSKDAEHAANLELAAAHYAAYESAVKTPAQQGQGANPNLEATPFNPSAPGAAQL